MNNRAVLIAVLAGVTLLSIPQGSWADCKSEQQKAKTAYTNYMNKLKSGAHVDPMQHGTTIGMLMANLEKMGCYNEVDEMEAFMIQQIPHAGGH